MASGNRVSLLVVAMSLGASGMAGAKSTRHLRHVAAPANALETSLIEAAPAELGGESGTEAGWVAPRDPQLLNRAEMLSLVQTLAREVAGALLEGERHREEAVRDRDGIKLACIQDRLASMKVMKGLSDSRLAATRLPRIQADDLSLRHEFRGVEMAHQRVLQLQQELVECVGENLQASRAGDGTTIPVSPAGALDPAATTIIESPPIDRPMPASTYQ